MSRPFLNQSVDELEALFAARQGDVLSLRQLAAELNHRRSRRAQRLAQQVGNALASLQHDAPLVPERTLVQPSLGFAGVETVAVEERRSRPARSQRRARTHADDSNSAPDVDTFTLIQPCGVQPRPSAFKPSMQRDLQLDLSEGDRRPKRFRVALAQLISEMRRQGTGRQQFVLEHGEQVNTETDQFSYRFEFAEEANVFEGARVDLIVGGRTTAGRLTAILQGRIVITLDEDFGPTITTCILRLDNTALLQALHDRLVAIERGDAAGFRADFAERVLDNGGTAIEGSGDFTWPWPHRPTAAQRQFVQASLIHDVTWLWGPPGTGKTDCLSALCRVLYEARERVLVCSNTNQAVDQLLLKLCRQMRETGDPALDQGRILREGRIEADLEREFGDYIIPDRVVERRSRELKQRESELKAELERLGREVAFAKATIARFQQLEAARRVAQDAATARDEAAGRTRSTALQVSTAEARLASVKGELASFLEAGAFRRFFMRSEQEIQNDIGRQQKQFEERRRARASAAEELVAKQAALDSSLSFVQSAEQAVAGEDPERHRRVIAEHPGKIQPLHNELKEIAAKLEALRSTVLREASIVGATVTRTFLRPADFTEFQTVVVDEASMILLPAVFVAVGLAAKRVIVAGDFQQLPPIVQTEQEAIFDVLGHDVFQEAGIANHAAFSGQSARHVMLSEQFRMTDSLCEIVSRTFYNGALLSHPDAVIPRFDEPPPLHGPLTLIDTSRIWPFSTRNAFRSRLNLMHALAVRNLVLHLQENGRLFDGRGKGRVGVCAPYAAQAQLIRTILKSHKLAPTELRVATVHGFQGDERALLMLDLVDSIGERNAGIFLQANELRDSGAKLLNVALSRTREGIVIVGNLTFLDKKLPSDAILRGILCEVQRVGQVVDVQDVLRLRPIADDLRDIGASAAIDPDALRTGLFRGPDFGRLCPSDLANAKKSIVIFSGFITPDRVAQLGDVLRERIAASVRVRCVTRPPNKNGSMPEELGLSALQALEAIGVTLDLRSWIHEKVIIVDGKIVWFGSLNPLSHTHRTSEVMVRVDNEELATHLAGLLSLRRRAPEDVAGERFAEAENPRCETCGGWSVLMRGRFGPYFQCSNGDGWRCNLDMRRRPS